MCTDIEDKILEQAAELVKKYSPKYPELSIIFTINNNKLYLGTLSRTDLEEWSNWDKEDDL